MAVLFSVCKFGNSSDTFKYASYIYINLELRKKPGQEK